MSTERIETIHKFWFENITDKTIIKKKQTPFKNWFLTNKLFDQKITKQFLDNYESAKNHQYDDWISSPRGWLVLILILDQFSRNLFRNNAKMYETDAQAQKIVLDGIKNKNDAKLMLIERIFIYMPLMHSENVELHKISIQCFTNLCTDSKKMS